MRLPPAQATLLRAALLPAPAGVAAWREWRAAIDIVDIDRGSSRLLPLLWHNLLANEVEDSWLPRFKGVYRHTWFGNQLWMRTVRRVDAVLGARGLDGLWLKGIALANGCYPNPGLRPMDDLDLLVPPADLPLAMAALREAGWSTPTAHPERVLQVVHGVEFRAAGGERLDLHGHLFQGSLDGRLDGRRWARAETLTLADGPLRVLEPTDQLLHVLVHGVESDPPAPRWLADALMLIRRSRAQLDWPRLLEDAAAEGRSLAVARALGQLVGVLGPEHVPVPADVLAGLRVRRWPLGERFEQRISAGPRLFAVGYLAQRYVDYRRWRRGADEDGTRPPRGQTGFADYLRLNWGLDSLRQLPGQVWRRGLRGASHDVGRLFDRLRPQRGPAGEPSSRA